MTEFNAQEMAALKELLNENGGISLYTNHCVGEAKDWTYSKEWFIGAHTLADNQNITQAKLEDIPSGYRDTMLAKHLSTEQTRQDFWKKIT
jgi:hypothetical protein